MYDSELRERRQLIRQLESKIDQIVSRYESNLRDLQNGFNKINGVAEKQIDEELASLKSEIEKILKDFERQMESELKEVQKEISEQENHMLHELQEYKDSCMDSFSTKTKKMILLQGEL